MRRTGILTKLLRRCGAQMLIPGIVGLVSVAASAQPKVPEKGAQEPKKTGSPTFISVWKIPLPADTQRAAVADLTGAGKPQLLTLSPDGTLTVHHMVDGKPVKETSVALGKDAARFVVGRFAKDRPALIVAPGATCYWDKTAFVQKPGPQMKGVFASLRLKNGAESFFVFEQGTPPTSYVVDPSGQSFYKSGPEVPQPTPRGSSIRELVLEFARELFDNGPFPEAIKQGGVARLFTPQDDDKLYGLFAWQTAEGPYVAVLDGGSLFPEPKADATPLWKSAKLAGKVRDIAMGPDIQGTKATGFYVLHEAGADSKECVLEFFGPE